MACYFLETDGGTSEQSAQSQRTTKGRSGYWKGNFQERRAVEFQKMCDENSRTVRCVSTALNDLFFLQF
jgi:hypothetical protein